MSKVTLAKLTKSLEEPKLVFQGGRFYWGDSSIILVNDPRLSRYFRRTYGIDLADSEKNEICDLTEYEGRLGYGSSHDPSQTLDIDSIVREVRADQEVLMALPYYNLKFFDLQERELIAFGLANIKKHIDPSENIVWVDKLRADYISDVFTRLQTQWYMVPRLNEEWMHDAVLTPWFMLSDHPFWLFYMVNKEEVRAAIRVGDEEGTVFGGALTVKDWEELFQKL